MPAEPRPDLAAQTRLVENEHDKWQHFYSDRARRCPFFVDVPDENLAAWLGAGRIKAGRALDVGCGQGRNAIWLAQQGFDVQAVDLSTTAITWAAERIAAAGVHVTLHLGSVLDLPLAPASFDLIYDSGCFHHMPPHLRDAYVDHVADALRPGAAFGLLCFAPDSGSGLDDDEVYRRSSLAGGLGYDDATLRALWARRLHVEELRRIRAQSPDSGRFGEPYLWAMLARAT